MPCSPKNDPLFACLVLERARLTKKGACFSPAAKQTDAGKEHELVHPDITFDSLLISRKHCCIEQRGEGWSICELKSKHGAAERRPLPQSYPSRSSTGIKSVWRQTLCRCGFPDPELDQTLDYNCADFTGALPCRNRPPRGHRHREKVLAGRRRGSYAVGEGMAPARTGV